MSTTTTTPPPVAFLLEDDFPDSALLLEGDGDPTALLLEDGNATTTAPPEGTPLNCGLPQVFFRDFTITDGRSEGTHLSLAAQLNRFFKINKFLTILDVDYIEESSAKTNQRQYGVRLTMANCGVQYQAIEFADAFSDGDPLSASFDVDTQFEGFFNNTDNDYYPVFTMLTTRTNDNTRNGRRLLTVYADAGDLALQARNVLLHPVIAQETILLEQLGAFQSDNLGPSDVAPRGINLGNDVWPTGGPHVLVKSPLTNTWAGIARCCYGGAGPLDTQTIPACNAIVDCCGEFAGILLDPTTGYIVEEDFQ